MSKKAHKKRHSQSTAAAKRRAVANEIADQKDRDRNRMKPMARTILLGDLVLLALTQLLTKMEVISDFFSGLLTIIGVGLLLLALYIQFQPNNSHRSL